VIHRDVKPENILLADQALLADFGIARALSEGKRAFSPASGAARMAIAAAPGQIPDRPIQPGATARQCW
jgi:serine/threonine protein kinase